MRQYKFRIARSSATGSAAAAHVFAVDLEERMTVLDGLFKIQREQDPTLSFRCSCRVGMCGTCTVYVNRIPRLACRTRAATLNGDFIAVEPLPHLPVIKDLVVSMEPFFAQWKRILPAFHPADPQSVELARIPPSSEAAAHTHEKRDCITCGACFTACGIKSSSAAYLGPAAINKAFLRLMDPRDGRVEERLRVLNDEKGGIWRCHTQFNCVAVCPKGINLNDSIGRLKRAMLRPQKLLGKKIATP
ncbi:MAG TPA: succinate dehydrogenase/fumarate reductase iron-sulfur subunit [Acidobacteriota bacterium]|jgi:succinate dehydrogenase/fumarate reductase iron-sulfur protein